MSLKRLAEFLIYAAAGLVCVGAIVIWAVIGPDVSYTWYSFSAFTLIFALILVRMYWPARKSAKVWLLLALFMLAHVAFYIPFLEYVHKWSAFWYLLTVPCETMLFALLVYKCIHVLPPKVRL